ncbi:MAG: hypothetical protein H0V89_05870 [Deltaproteobacteria bacterium]|nr:hypothetical protein [Deltaproteobacteria bacterium]
MEHDPLKFNMYTVPCRLIDEQVSVRIYDDRLEVRFAYKLQVTIERLLGRLGHRINYRHVIWSLVRKRGPMEPKTPEASLVLLERALKLPGFVAHRSEIAVEAERAGSSFGQYLHQLVEIEMTERRARRVREALGRKLPFEKTLGSLKLDRFAADRPDAKGGRCDPRHHARPAAVRGPAAVRRRDPPSRRARARSGNPSDRSRAQNGTPEDPSCRASRPSVSTARDSGRR